MSDTHHPHPQFPFGLTWLESKTTWRTEKSIAPKPLPPAPLHLLTNPIIFYRVTFYRGREAMTSPQSQQGRDSVASIPRRKENQQTLRMFLRQVAASICSRAPSSYVEISNRLGSLRHQPQLPLLGLAARPAPQGQVCPTSSSPTIARFPRSTTPPTTAPWIELRPEAGSACGSLVRQ